MWVVFSVFLQAMLQVVAVAAIEPDDYGVDLFLESNARTPEFRGWYTRLTDFSQNRSLVVIGATQRLAGQEPADILPGFLAVVWSRGPDTLSRYVEVFPSKTSWTTTTLGGQNGPAFEWSAEGYGVITDTTISVSIPGVVEVDMQVQGRLSWNPKIPVEGPESIFQILPNKLLPLHWFVYNLGSEGSYAVEFADDAEMFQGSGWVHQEANWGTVFPSSWVWGQSQAENNEAQLTFSGGFVDFHPQVSIEGYYLGYRSPDISWSFNPTTTGFFFRSEKEVNGCAGTLRLSTGDYKRRLNIVATAPIDSFVELSVPATQGFERGAEESFYATFEVEVVRRRRFWFDKVLERRSFESAALEFGGGFRCQS
jgi:hypothetical protein